jgi:hypothetical protein
MNTWIYEDNLRAWLELVAGIVGYKFDELDWDAVRAGVADTDSEAERCYEYPLGKSGTRVELAAEPGTSVIAVRTIGATSAIQARFELVTSIAQSYRICPRSDAQQAVSADGAEPRS